MLDANQLEKYVQGIKSEMHAFDEEIGVTELRDLIARKEKEAKKQCF